MGGGQAHLNSGFRQVCCEGVADGSLEDGFVQVMAAIPARLGLDVVPHRGEGCDLEMEAVLELIH